MNQPTVYPLRFSPIFQYRLWGGRRLESLLSTPLPGDGPYGEAWILSDRDDFTSKVAEGPLQGRTITDVIATYPVEVMGSLAPNCSRFPLLLKFLDCREVLSVQVHPSDSQTELFPEGERGKTEAWVVLEADPTSEIYAGLNPGTSATVFREAIADKTIGGILPKFTPKVGDGVFVPAGTVHALGGGVVVFEVQENSDVTFRLYDWDRVDAKTGQSRELHVEKGIAAIDFTQGVGGPVTPEVVEKSPVYRESLFDCDHFRCWRIIGDAPSTVGTVDIPTVLVCLDGFGQVEHGGSSFGIGKGDVMLLPAILGPCVCRPSAPMTLLEIAIPGA